MKLWFGVQTVSTLFSWLTVAPSSKNIYSSIFQITCENIFKCATKYLVYKSALSGCAFTASTPFHHQGHALKEPGSEDFSILSYTRVLGQTLSFQDCKQTELCIRFRSI